MAGVNSAPMGPGMAPLAAAIDRFCDRRLAGRSPSDLARELTQLGHERDRLDLEFSRTAAAFAATDEYERQGLVSPIHWIRLNCHMGSGGAVERIAVGEQLERLSESVETMAEGGIGFV